MKIDEFKEALNKLKVSATEDQLQKLENYYNFLVEYNSHTNLTAITNKDDVYLKHFYDSLTVIEAIDLSGINNVIDIGSGAGFPGMVLKIFYPNLKITILDSNGKKTKFLTQLVDKLNLTDVEVINARAEEYARNNLNKYDLCVSRAVAFIDIITELSMPFINESGSVILMKGNIHNELSILERHYAELNIKEYSIKRIYLPITNDERNLIVLTKNNATKKVMNYSQIIKRNKIWNNK